MLQTPMGLLYRLGVPLALSLNRPSLNRRTPATLPVVSWIPVSWPAGELASTRTE